MSPNVFSVLLALAIVGCSQAPAQNLPADSSDTAAASEVLPAAGAPTGFSAADDERALRAAVAAFYAPLRDPEGSAGAADELPDFTPEFDAAWDDAVGGPDFALDFDPFCDCQDPEGLTGADVETVAISGDVAIVGVTLQWPDSSPRKQLTFKRSGGKWLLDDISSGEWTSLHRAMAEAEPGSWGIG